jgi:hypothetical protein
MSTVAAVVLAMHGLITTMIGWTTVTSPSSAPMPMPAWFSWWPGPFGRSWLLDWLNLGNVAGALGGLLWLVAGVALIGAGLGWLGAPVLRDAWQLLALGGAVVGLLALGLYFHPFYLVAVAINVAIVVLLSGRLLTAQ